MDFVKCTECEYEFDLMAKYCPRCGEAYFDPTNKNLKSSIEIDSFKKNISFTHIAFRLLPS